jgi:DNA polymerase
MSFTIDLKDPLWSWYRELGVDVSIEETSRSQRPNSFSNTSTASKEPIASYPSLFQKEVKTDLSSPNKNTKDISLSDLSLSKDFGLSSIKTREELAHAMQAIEGCAPKETALSFVFSDGSPNARIMIIGEAPGADEDKQGKPFVGISGQLLDKIFLSIGLTREEHLYIANILPWRPPANRQPNKEEVALMLPFVKKHAELMKPDLLLCVGGVSTKALFDTTEGISTLRGRFRPLTLGTHTTKAMAMYHPAYLLRSPGQKAKVWEDIILLRKECDALGISRMPF